MAADGLDARRDAVRKFQRGRDGNQDAENRQDAVRNLELRQRGEDDVARYGNRHDPARRRDGMISDDLRALGRIGLEIAFAFLHHFVKMRRERLVVADRRHVLALIRRSDDVAFRADQDALALPVIAEVLHSLLERPELDVLADGTCELARLVLIRHGRRDDELAIRRVLVDLGE